MVQLLVSILIGVVHIQPLMAAKHAYLDRKYNQVTQIKIHNATSTTQKKLYWFIPNLVANQNNTLDQQLADGMRAFKVPVHPVAQGAVVVPWATHTLQDREISQYVTEGVAALPLFIRPLFAGSFKNYVNTTLLHNLWKIDLTNQPFQEVLVTLKSFLDAHPNEIITLFLNIFDLPKMSQEFLNVFTATGIDTYLHPQAITQEWPTIRELIARNKRLILFADERIPLPGFNYSSDFLYSNDYMFKTLDQLNADTGAGVFRDSTWQRKIKYIQNPLDLSNPDNTLFDITHIVTPGIAGNAKMAFAANAYDSVMAHIQRSSATLLVTGKTIVPNFIGVDFYDQNMQDLKRVVAQLNG